MITNRARVDVGKTDKIHRYITLKLQELVCFKYLELCINASSRDLSRHAVPFKKEIAS